MDNFNSYGDAPVMRPESTPAAEAISVSPAAAPADPLDALKAKYGKIYRVHLTLEPDDDTEVELEYCFKKPSTASYDRYVKTMSGSMTKASVAFVRDNIIEEHKAKLERDLDEYPALALSVSEKLLSMLGISKVTNLKLV